MIQSFLLNRHIRLLFIVAGIFSVASDLHAASQFAAFFDQVKKAERDPDHQSEIINAVPLDFSSMKASEEIPAILGALRSGDPLVMEKAVMGASELCRRLSGVGRAQPRIDTATKTAIQPVVAEAISHFGDPRPLSTEFNGQNDWTERAWKLSVIDLVSASNSAPSREMVDWMEQAVSTASERAPKAIRQIAESYAAVGNHLTQVEKDSFVREADEDNQEVFRHIAPALASVRPLGPDELRTLLVLIHEPDTTTKIVVIDQIAKNQITDPAVIRELMAAALTDPDIPVWVRHGMQPFPVRVAAINALGALDAKIALPDLRRIAATEDDDRKWAALTALQKIEGPKTPQ